MTQSLPFARYYEAVRDGCGSAKLAANWLMGEVSKRLNAEGRSVGEAMLPAPTLAALIKRVVDGTVSNSGARQVFEALWPQGAAAQPASVDSSIAAKGLKQMNDSSALEAIVAEVIKNNAKSVDEYRAGKEKAFNALVGQVMKASAGKANPAQAGELLKRLLSA
jgi:aspartyl-tRNA(Asn)/glutamyl-tRNA(Gln) amidotransferase subunit B